MDKLSILNMFPERFHPFIKGTYYSIFPERKNDADFSGWGMVLHNKTMPWEGADNEISEEFIEVESDLKNNYDEDEFVFNHFIDDKDDIEEHRWRSYVVYWTAVHAAKFAGDDEKRTLVECGVGEGISAFYSMKAFKNCEKEFTTYLYDSWDMMREEELLESEAEQIGKYEDLKKKVTEDNLQEFRDTTIYREGYIPEVFDKDENPDSISWLHIDLNSAIPTQKVLENFYDRVEEGGIILFDDYGWSRYTETKKVVDHFFKNHDSGIHLPLPTGQSIYFKKS